MEGLEIRGIDRTNDYAFKRIFGSAESKDVLLGFLNDVLVPAPGQELVDLKIDDRELDPEFVRDRAARLDILATTSTGTLVNIEVQVTNKYDIDRRTLFYWARLYQGQLTKGKKFAELCQTITINILVFDWFTDDERPHHSFHVTDDETGKVFCDQLEIHFLELIKAKKLKHPPETALEEWLLYLNNVEGEEMDAIAEKNPGIKKALSIEEVFWKTDRDRRLYELREKAIRDEISQMAGAKAEGLAEGKKEGLAEGKIQTTQKHIADFLAARFGPGSAELQTKAGELRDPAVADRVFSELLIANSLKEAGRIMTDGLAKSRPES